MKELEIKHRQEIEYRELFDVMIDSHSCEDYTVGLTNDGKLLYIENKLMNNSSAYWVQSVFYSINQEEFRSFLELAKARGYLETAISKGRTTEEELKRLGEQN